MSEPEPELGRSSAPAMETALTGLLLLARVVLLALFVREITRGNVGGPTVFRFRDIALAHGTPWRDFSVEYAPLDWLVIKALFATSVKTAALRLALLAFLADVAAFLGIRRGWGSHAGLLYLLAAFPLQRFIYQRDDLIGVALAVWALALAGGSRERAGGVTLAASVLVKIWSLALLPVLWLQGRIRSLGWAVASIAVGAMVWVGAAGFAGPRDVFTFRGATGWHVESPIGWIVWIVSGDRATLQRGAYRVGVRPGWASALLAVAIVSGLVAGAARERRRPTGDPAGLPALAAVSWLLLLSPLVSTQYVSWLLPWAAVAEREGKAGRAAFVSALGAAIATAFMDEYASFGRPLAFRLAVLARNLAMSAPVVIWLVAPREAPAHLPDTMPASQSS